MLAPARYRCSAKILSRTMVMSACCLFGNSPNQDVNLAWVLREIGGDLLADKGIRQIANLQTAIDRVVVGDRDEIHPALDKLSMELPRIGVTIRKIEPPKQPFLRPRAETGVNVEVTFAHIYLERPA